jgi:hypothetical protein
MDMDPINKKIKMKNVAGFQPCCVLRFFLGSVAGRDRRGFGTRDFQKDGSATEAMGRTLKGRGDPNDLSRNNGWRNAAAKAARRSTTRDISADLVTAILAVLKRMVVVGELGKCGTRRSLAHAKKRATAVFEVPAGNPLQEVESRHELQCRQPVA